MNLGRWIEILANVGVIAGILFLGYEIRQNNELLETEVGSTRQLIRANDFLLPLEYPDLAEALIEYQKGNELSEYQHLILNRAMATILLNWQFVHAEYSAGRIDEQSIPIQSWRNAFHGQNASEAGYWPDMSELWDSSASTVFDPEFVAWMNDNVVSP